jgi:hypothetical protein
MKRFGYVLIAISFLAGSYFAVIDTDGVAWTGAIPSLLLGLAGVAMVQLQVRGSQRASDTVKSNIEQLDASLQRIANNAAELDRGKESVDPYDFGARIDELFMADLDIFVDNRETIGHAYGLQAYADVMTSFATGERYLNRCWSASTDGYVDEVHTYLTRAHTQFEDALSQLRRHRATAPPA